MGSQYMGEHIMADAFKTFPELNYYSTSTCQANPTRSLWSEDTSYYFYINNDLYDGSYVMLEWDLIDPTYGEYSEYEE